MKPAPVAHTAMMELQMSVQHALQAHTLILDSWNARCLRLVTMQHWMLLTNTVVLQGPIVLAM